MAKANLSNVNPGGVMGALIPIGAYFAYPYFGLDGIFPNVVVHEPFENVVGFAILFGAFLGNWLWIRIFYTRAKPKPFNGSD